MHVIEPGPLPGLEWCLRATEGELAYPPPPVLCWLRGLRAVKSFPHQAAHAEPAGRPRHPGRKVREGKCCSRWRGAREKVAETPTTTQPAFRCWPPLLSCGPQTSCAPHIHPLCLLSEVPRSCDLLAPVHPLESSTASFVEPAGTHPASPALKEALPQLTATPEAHT